MQDAVNLHRSRLAELEDTLRKIKSNPTVVNEEGFKQKLGEVQEKVKQLYEIAKTGSGSDKKTLVEQLAELRDTLMEISETLTNADETAADAKRTALQGQMSIDEAEKVLEKIHDQLAVSY